MNLIKFHAKFKDEQACRDYLAAQRWGSQPTCPHCKHPEIYKYEDGRLFKCAKCKKQFTVRIGTIFEDSRVPLVKWFVAIYLFSSLKKGISSIQLSKYIEVTQKTAWFMLHRIREVMQAGDGTFGGITEIDEAYFGGSEANKHAKNKGKTEKTIILGMINRETGKAKAIKIDSAKTPDLQDEIYKHTQNGSTIVTDSYAGYDFLKWTHKHEFVKHCAGEYVKNDGRTAFKIHTNTVEGFWSQLKRGIYGTYHWASKKHIQKYMHEFTFRYNERLFNDFEKFSTWFCACDGKRVFYKQLIA